MKFIREIIKNSRVKKILQDKSNTNRAALNCLNELGYPLPKIRHALIVLNGIKFTEIKGEVSIPSISYAIKGLKKNPTAIMNISQALNLEPEELFSHPGRFVNF